LCKQKNKPSVIPSSQKPNSRHRYAMREAVSQRDPG